MDTGLLEIEILMNRIEKDKRFTPKTKPQVSTEMYAKWLTDKYNKDTGELKNEVGRLQAKLKTAESKLKISEDNNSKKRLKYQNEKGEFLKELYKEDILIQYKAQVRKLSKTIVRLRRENERLIVENLKLKGEL